MENYDTSVDRAESDYDNPASPFYWRFWQVCSRVRSYSPPMVFSSTSVFFFCSSVAIYHIPVTFGYPGGNYAPLILPNNVTNSILATDSAARSIDSVILPNVGAIDDGIVWPENLPSANVSLSPNVSASIKPALGGTSPQFSCNGKAYGKNLDLGSCLEALAKMPASDSAVTFGERNHGDWGANLPLRVLSTNGICALDISHRAGVYMDEIAPSDLKESARVLIDICVKGNPNTGGVVSNIGKNGNLALRVTPYRPNVRCSLDGSAPPPSDCRHLVDLMQVDGKRQIFGPEGDPDPEITITLPQGFYTYKRRCQVFIDTLVPGSGKDACDWYKLCEYTMSTFRYGDSQTFCRDSPSSVTFRKLTLILGLGAAANAVEYMCVHTSRSGMALQLGESVQLYHSKSRVMQDPYGTQECDVLQTTNDADVLIGEKKTLMLELKDMLHSDSSTAPSLAVA
ncbi:hypothetical protein ACLMJK_005338 [Lecanora helva]